MNAVRRVLAWLGIGRRAERRHPFLPLILHDAAGTPVPTDWCGYGEIACADTDDGAHNICGERAEHACHTPPGQDT